MMDTPSIDPNMKKAFKIQDNDNVVLNHCRTLWENMENFDVIFTKIINLKDVN